MPFESRLNEVMTKVIPDKERRALTMVSLQAERYVKENLTGVHLSIATGSGRRSVFSTYSELAKAALVGFTAWYLAAYETGDWKEYSSITSADEKAEYGKRYRDIVALRGKSAALQFAGLSRRQIIRDSIKWNMDVLNRIFRGVMSE